MSRKQKRRRRDRRLANPERIVLQERDLDVVEAVYKFRVLRQNQIAALFFPHNTEATSRAAAQRRLVKLYDHGYLERRFFPVVRNEGRSPTLYILDRKGADLLKTERGYDGISWHHESKNLKTEFLHHTLAINDVMVTMTVACRERGWQLESWLTENEIKADYDWVHIRTATGRTQRVAVLPDSYFSIVARQRRYPFFLELDRGTTALKRFKNKIRAYLDYYRTGLYHQRYGNRSLRVLTVTLGEKRLANLKQATEETNGEHWFWFAVLTDLTAETVLTAPLWRQAGRQETGALIGID